MSLKGRGGFQGRRQKKTGRYFKYWRGTEEGPTPRVSSSTEKTGPTGKKGLWKEVEGRREIKACNASKALNVGLRLLGNSKPLNISDKQKMMKQPPLKRMLRVGTYSPINRWIVEIHIRRPDNNSARHYKACFSIY